MHGSERDNQAYCDAFQDLADAAGMIVLAPLFPCGIIDPDDTHNYKYIEYAGIRFDRVLLDMVAEVEARYRLAGRRLWLFGFSGGAHFAHRFAYLHPARLDAVSICAPGSPTLLDAGLPWWLGVADLEQRFGVALNLEAIRRLRIHLAVGEQDLGTAAIAHRPGSAHWMPGADALGATRVERLAALAASLRRQGVAVHEEQVPGAAHDRAALIACAKRYFRSLLEPERLEPELLAS